MRRYGLLIFEILLLLLTIFFVVVAIDYNERARLVPILIGIPTFLLVSFQIAVDHVPALARFGPGRVEIASMSKTLISKEKKPELPEREIRRRELTALSWVVGLGAALTVFGFYIVLPLFLLGFLLFVARIGWMRSVISTAVTMGLLYISFVWFLRVDFYSGIFPVFG